ncbi:hypothetical protein TWF730_000123 [Orbilia blumenaviensis]|uniref:Peptidase metallopeptidase domain-containing protein n=1 Tax=Orbilia blumenaviensis TaxID=1796055 RepID=A0AAV9VKU1_9PEZI
MSSSDDPPYFCAQMFLPSELAEEGIRKAIEKNPGNELLSPGMPIPAASDIIPAFDMGPSGPGYRAPALALFVGKRWKNGQTLRVRFLDLGTPYIRSKVKQYANVWSEYANIYFKFVDSGYANIRVTFNPKGGSWSYVGTDAEVKSQDEPTMNFGWFNDNTPEESFSRTVTHEFGHAIGCVHEHSQPKAEIQWNKEFIYNHYAGVGWDRDTVDFNIFSRYTTEEVESTEFDSTSIMQYPIYPGFTTNGFVLLPNTRLSQKDKEFIRKMYPMNSSIPSPFTAVSGTAARNLEVGTFNTISAQRGQSTSSLSRNTKGRLAIINFSNHYDDAPELVMGLNLLNFENSQKLRILPSVGTVRSRQAMLNLKSWNNATQDASGLSWLLLPPGNKEFQWGTFTTKQARTEEAISFSNQYSSDPRVLVFFTTLDIDKSANCCIDTYPSEVTTRGFKLNIETWSNTKLLECGVSWVALPAGEDIASGTFNTDDIRASDNLRPNTRGKVAFRAGFTKPPKSLFLALNMLNMEKDTETRIRLYASNITKDEMDWHIDSWGNTTLYAAAATFIAIGS